MRLVKKIAPWGLLALLSILPSGCLFESGKPTPAPAPSRLPATATRPAGPARPSPTLEGGRVRYGCEDPWYLEPASATPKITKSEAEVRIRAFLQERGPREAVELIETHYGIWIQGGDEPAGSPTAKSPGERAVWLLVFRWRPWPGPDPTPPPGFAYRLHGIVDAQTGEPLAGCSQLMPL
jgi:hypothetical protein